MGGIFIIPALYGAITALVYRRFRARPSVFWLIIYIEFLLSVTLAFRTHRFFGNYLLYFGLIAIGVELLAGRRVEESGTMDVHPPAMIPERA